MNEEEDTYLLGNSHPPSPPPPHALAPKKQFDALGKSQRGRLVHHRSLFDVPAAQQEVVTWHLGPQGEDRLQQGLWEQRHWEV